MDIKDEMDHYNSDQQNHSMDIIEKIRKTLLNENKEKLSLMETILNNHD